MKRGLRVRACEKRLDEYCLDPIRDEEQKKCQTYDENAVSARMQMRSSQSLLFHNNAKITANI